LQYLADLRTTASGLSSISNSTSNQRRESSYVGTRSSDLSDSDSDSDEDEDDDFELINEFEDGNLGLRGIDDDNEDEDAESDDEDEIPIISNNHGNEGVNLVDKLKQLIFHYDDIASGREEELDSHMGHFTMESGGLWVESQSFQDPLECFEKVGGFGLHVVARLTQGTNRYFHKSIKPSLCRNLRWHKLRWTDVTVEEMYHFLGILLKI
jgi:hypothetical protein